MAIAVRGAGTAALASSAAATSLSVTPTYPAGIQQYDVAFAQIIYKNLQGNLATPDGWTLVNLQTSGTIYNVVAYKRLDGTETDGPTFSGSFATNGMVDSKITVFSGVARDRAILQTPGTSGGGAYSIGGTISGSWTSATADNATDNGTQLTFFALDRTIAGNADTYKQTFGYPTFTYEASGSQFSGTPGGSNSNHNGFIRVYDLAYGPTFSESLVSSNTSQTGNAYWTQLVLNPDIYANTPRMRGEGPLELTNFSTSGTALTKTATAVLPSGWKVGDVAIAMFQYGSNYNATFDTTKLTPPAGWIKAVEHLTTINGVYSAFYYKVLSSGDSNPAFVYQSPAVISNFSLGAQAFVYGGVSASGVESIVTTSGTSTQPRSNSSPSLITAPNSTASRNNSTVVYLASSNYQSTISKPISPKAYYDDKQSNTLGSFYYNSILVTDFYQPLAGAANPSQFYNSNGFNTVAYGVTSLVLMGADVGETLEVIQPTIQSVAKETADGFKGDYINTTPAATPTYVGAGAIVSTQAAASATNRTVTPALLASTTTGDLVVAYILTTGSTNDITPATSGVWTPFGPTTTVGTNNTTTSLAFRAFYRYHDGSTANGNFQSILTNGGSGNGAISAVTHTYRGAGTAANPPENFVIQGYPSSTSTSWPGVGIVTSRPNNFLVQGYANSGNTAANPPTGWTERTDSSSASPTGTSGLGFKINTIAVAAATTTTGGNEATVNAGTFTYVSFGFALSASVKSSDRYQYLADTEDQGDTYSGAMTASTGPTFGLAATESPADSFSASVSAVANSNVQLSATEANDTYAGSTTATTSLTLTDTEDYGDSFSGSTTATTNATLTANEPTDTYAGSTTAVTSANLTSTEAKDTYSGSSTSVTTVALSGQEATDSYSGAVSATTSVTFAPTESADTFSAVVSTRVEMQFNAYETPDSYAGSTAVVSYVQFGNSTEGPDNYAGTVAATTPFTVAATDGPDSYSGSATITGTTTLAATESPADSFSGSANAFTSMQIGATETRDTIQSSFAITGTMQVSATEPADTTSMAYDTRTVATLAANEAPDTYAGPMGITANLYFISTEARDSFAGTYGINSNVQVQATDTADSFSGAIDNRTLMTVSATEPVDSYAGPMGITGSYTIGATEGPDAFFMPITATTTILLGATEAKDTYAGIVRASSDFRLAGAEGNDNFAGAVQAVTTASLAATETRDGYAGAHAVVASVQVSGTENTGDSFAGSVNSSVDFRLGATEGTADSLSASIEVRGSLNLTAAEGAADSFNGSAAVVGSLQLSGVETGSDRFRGHLYNRASQNDMYVNTENGWTAVNPVLVNVANKWIEPKAGYVRVANGTWVRIYGKL